MSPHTKKTTSTKNTTSLPAKITRPSSRNSLPRQRLFRLLDDCEKPVVWIEAPAGSGKTTLVASYLNERKLSSLWYQIDESDSDIASFFYYLGQAARHSAPYHKKPLPVLTPEYLQGIPIFTRRYFEQLFQILKAPNVIVFDNYQDVTSGSDFHQMMSHALQTIPEGICVIILSRAVPPPEFSRLRANNSMYYLGWKEVRFTFEESRELLHLHTSKILSDDDLAVIHAKIDGWAAGYILLLERLANEGLVSNELRHLNSGAIFDYFASQLFDKTDARIQDFLIITSLLPTLTIPLAKNLTGIEDTEQILDYLTRHNFFTHKYMRDETIYQYHALFREFLLVRAQNYLDMAEMMFIKRKATSLLLDAGRAEDAINLLLQAGDWEASIRIILRNAPELIAQGRHRTLEEWLITLPESYVHHTPWLLYWHGVCRLMLDPLEARLHFERAFVLFDGDEDAAGLYLSWASIIQTFVYAWADFGPIADRWIAEFEALFQRHPVFPSPEVEARAVSGIFNALFWANPLHPELPYWAMRLHHRLVGSDTFSSHIALGTNLVQYHLVMGDFAKAPVLVEALKPESNNACNDILALQWWYGIKSMCAWFSADHSACLAAIKQGVLLGEKTGACQMAPALFSQGIFSALTHEDLAAADDFLSRMASTLTPRTLDKCIYHHMHSLVAWSRGALHKAFEHGELALRLAEESRSPFIIAVCRLDHAITLHDMKLFEEADKTIDLALDSTVGLNQLEFVSRLFHAWFALQRNDTDRGLTGLRAALQIGAKQNYVNFSRWRPRMMAQICAIALDNDIETDYVRHLISVRNLLPPSENMSCPEAWPWPVRIRTLGNFAIECNGKPLHFAGKVQRQPLALLKLLIAHGGREVAESWLVDALWPDTEGDAARVNLRSSVHRLRKLIGTDAVHMEDGRLSLARTHCWVDAWALAHRLKEEDGTARGHTSADITRRVLALYNGPFLEHDTLPEVISLRERLRQRVLRHVLQAGESLHPRGEWQAALSFYERALEIDSFSEPVYRGLMLCHYALGDRAGALRVYGRCCAILKSRFALAPSPETKELADRANTHDIFF